MQTYLIVTIILISVIFAIIIIIVIIKRNISIKENKIFNKKTFKNTGKTNQEIDNTLSKNDLNYNRIHLDINKLKSTFKLDVLLKSEIGIIQNNELFKSQTSSVDLQNHSKHFSSHRKTILSRNFEENEKSISSEIKTKITHLNEKDHLTTLTKSNTKRSFKESCYKMRTFVSSKSILKQ